MSEGRPRSAYVVGTGLLGTSVALALSAAGVEVWLADRDPRTAELAADLGAGVAGRPPKVVDVAVVAVPPAAIAATLRAAQREGVALAYTDLGSVKRGPLEQADALGCVMTTVVGGHPMAGGERSGPAAARADLFTGRPWVLCPVAATGPAALASVRGLVETCGATPVAMAAEDHDRAVALVSHVPHVAACLAAARLADAPAAELALAGPGVRDVTRVAGSDPALWGEVLRGNAAALTDVLEDMHADLGALLQALRSQAEAGWIPAGTTGTGVIEELLSRGRAGRERIPGKHGAAPTAFADVRVLVPDAPGALARLFHDAGDAGVNIEDVTIDHDPGQPSGLVTLAVRPEVAVPLSAALTGRGWDAGR